VFIWNLRVVTRLRWRRLLLRGQLLEDAPQVGLRLLADDAAVPHPGQRQGVPCDPPAGRGDSEEFTRVRSLHSGADHDGVGRLDAVAVECHADDSGGVGAADDPAMSLIGAALV